MVFLEYMYFLYKSVIVYKCVYEKAQMSYAPEYAIERFFDYTEFHRNLFYSTVFRVD